MWRSIQDEELFERLRRERLIPLEPVIERALAAMAVELPWLFVVTSLGYVRVTVAGYSDSPLDPPAIHIAAQGESVCLSFVGPKERIASDEREVSPEDAGRVAREMFTGFEPAPS